MAEDDGEQIAEAPPPPRSSLSSSSGGERPSVVAHSSFMSDDEEAARVHEDVFGLKLPAEALREDRLAALDREIGLIPPDRRVALDMARRGSPVQFASSSHVSMLIKSDQFDATDAAWRLARYWEKRVDMFGESAFGDEMFADPSYEDYLRYYHKCERVLDDHTMDKETKNIAREFVNCVNVVKIEALDSVLEGAPMTDKGALVEAQKRGVANSNEHKLMFLRREDFKEVKAAERMMKYWEMKRLLFGPDIYHRKITQYDFEFRHDKFCFLRLMPGTDRHGRSILAILANALEGDGWSHASAGRYYWYVVHIAMDMPSCQKNGLVVLLNYRAGSRDLGERLGPFRQFSRSMLFDMMPFHVRSTHVFFEPSSWWQWTLAAIFSKFASKFQKRVVIHRGTNEENRFELEHQFGISVDNIPREVGGDYGLDSWIAWLKERKEQEIEMVEHRLRG